MIENLNRTQLRLTTETELGSGIAAEEWIDPPVVSAQATRGFARSVSRKDVFRNLSARMVLAEDWLLTTSHEMGEAFFAWFASRALDFTEGPGSEFEMALTPEAVEQSFTLFAESESGSISQFCGMTPLGISIRGEESRIVSFEIRWAALSRLQSGSLPEASEETFSGEEASYHFLKGGLVATYKGQGAMTSGAWTEETREDGAQTIFAFQIFFERQSQAAQFGLNRKPVSYTRAPWDVTGEIYLPESVVTTEAFSYQWQGKIRLWFDNLFAEMNNVLAFVTDEELRVYDVRVRTLVFEALGDEDRALAIIKRDRLAGTKPFVIESPQGDPNAGK